MQPVTNNSIHQDKTELNETTSTQLYTDRVQDAVATDIRNEYIEGSLHETTNDNTLNQHDTGQSDRNENENNRLSKIKTSIPLDIKEAAINNKHEIITPNHERQQILDNAPKSISTRVSRYTDSSHNKNKNNNPFKQEIIMQPVTNNSIHQDKTDLESGNGSVRHNHIYKCTSQKPSPLQMAHHQQTERPTHTDKYDKIPGMYQKIRTTPKNTKTNKLYTTQVPDCVDSTVTSNSPVQKNLKSVLFRAFSFISNEFDTIKTNFQKKISSTITKSNIQNRKSEATQDSKFRDTSNHLTKKKRSDSTTIQHIQETNRAGNSTTQ
jgi:hypothetical protein